MHHGGELLELLPVLTTSVELSNHQMGKVVNHLFVAQLQVIRFEHLFFSIDHRLQNGLGGYLVEVEFELWQVCVIGGQRSFHIVGAITRNDRESDFESLSLR